MTSLPPRHPGGAPSASLGSPGEQHPTYEFLRLAARTIGESLGARAVVVRRGDGVASWHTGFAEAPDLLPRLEERAAEALAARLSRRTTEPLISAVPRDERGFVSGTEMLLVPLLRMPRSPSLAGSGDQPDGVIVILQETLRPLFAPDERMLDNLTHLVESQLAAHVASARLERVHAALGEVIHGVALTSGEAFFPSLLEHIARATGMRHGLIAETMEAAGGPAHRARTLALLADGRIEDNVEFGLAGTPCAQVLVAGAATCERDVAERFPRDSWLREHGCESYVGLTLPRVPGRPLGWISLMGDGALEDREFVDLVLRTFANRISSELERIHSEAELRRANELLERKVDERTRELARMNEELASAVARLRASEERYALAAEGANDGLWDWCLLSGQVYYSPRWAQILGLDESRVDGSPDAWLSRIHLEDRERVERELSSHLRGESEHFESEHRVRHAGDAWVWVQVRGIAIRSPEGAATRIAGSLTDITQRKRTEQRLLHDAFYDRLTALPNRALFMDRLGRALERARRIPGRQCAVLFIDLDRFKIVNDGLGHLVGDRLLTAVARRLEQCLRSEDTVARLGGDEFVVLVEDVAAPADAIRVAERILRALHDSQWVDTHELFPTASIGIAVSSAEYGRPDELVRDADTAMYRAKAQGRARYQVFDAAMHAEAVALLELERDLRMALGRREFRVHYQPIIDVAGGHVVAFEALVRWQHPTRGLLSPDAFLQAAREIGIIHDIDRWVLEQSCVQARAWQQIDPSHRPAVSVNMCPSQFRRTDLARELGELLAANGLSGDALRLEITEGVLIDALGESTTFDELRRLGIELHVDDFGTGYSSLSYLHQYPLSALKIDRSFVHDLTTATTRFEIVRALVALAHNLGLKVIAEGVESAEQLELLRSLRCDHVQGYYLGTPVDADAAVRLLVRQLAGGTPVRGTPTP